MAPCTYPVPTGAGGANPVARTSSSGRLHGAGPGRGVIRDDAALELLRNVRAARLAVAGGQAKHAGVGAVVVIGTSDRPGDGVGTGRRRRVDDAALEPREVGTGR